MFNMYGWFEGSSRLYPVMLQWRISSSGTDILRRGFTPWKVNNPKSLHPDHL